MDQRLVPKFLALKFVAYILDTLAQIEVLFLSIEYQMTG